MTHRQPGEWRKEEFTISTNRSYLQLHAVQKAFTSDLLWWAKPIPDDQLNLMLDNCICFGVYLTSSLESGNPTQIGLARLVTDYVSVTYMTDVYILKEYQGHGLGSFMIRCVGEYIENWPNLRALVLFASPAEAAWYDKLLGMEELKSINGKDVAVMIKNGKGR